MRAFPLTVVKGGISRLRTKGGVRADWVYDLVNGYVTEQGTIVPREGTDRDTTLPDTTRGLCAFENLLHTFSADIEDDVPAGYESHVLSNPANDDADTDATLDEIHFAQPFMGALYVVAEWSDGEILHYWLGSNGDWEADTVYLDGDVVIPTTPNGFLYKATPNNPEYSEAKVWTPNTAYNVGDFILPTVYNGYYYEAIAVDGAVPSSGSSEPTWIASEGAITIEAAYSPTTAATSSDEEDVPSIPQEQQDRYGTEDSSSSASSSTSEDTAADVPKWSPGTLYNPGDIVAPRSATPAVPDAIPNANFESGDTAWDKGAGWHITNVAGGGNGHEPYQGSYYAYWEEDEAPDDTTWCYLEMSTPVPVQAGQFVSASCYEARASGSNNKFRSQLVLRWYDAMDVLVKETEGTESNTTKTWPYRSFAVSDLCPGGATKLVAAFKCKASGTPASQDGRAAVDAFVWDYQNLTPTEADYTTYQATQAAAGYSGTEEPAWPGDGNSVVDNEVTWLGGISSTIQWEAKPIMKSDGSEPTWQETAGSATPDGTISWIATTGLVEQAPASAIVAIGAKKIFAADEDIVKYSATVNPLDWTTANDAGYLPVGLHTHGANPTKVLNLYRGNLIPFNSAGFQMWQIDEDPALMQLLDAIPIGSTYQKAAQPVKNDLLFLTGLGVRNISIAGGSTTLQGGNYGEPIDSLVVAKLRAGELPNSIFYPARGQYWLWFEDEVFVLTLNDNAHSWSRYVFPEAITDATLLNNDLYLRTGTHKVWKVNEQTLIDDATSATVTITIASPAVVSWTAHGRANGDQVVFSTTGALPTGLTAGTTYYIVNQSTDSFNVAATEGGTAINTSGSQSGTHTATAGVLFSGVIQWPHLDMGMIGVQKMLSGFDLICTGTVGVQVGYDQRDFSVLTTSYELSGDTLPGTPIPLPVSAPSFSLKLTFAGNQAWEWIAANLYLQDNRGGGFAG